MARTSTPNDYRIESEYAVLILPNGMETKIDKEDLERARTRRWNAVKNNNGGFYVLGAHREGGKKTSLYLHRFLTDAPKGRVVDHINHDTLDNRRSANLRVCSNRDNSFNRRGSGLYNKTGHRGVSVHKTKEGYEMYVARITVAKYFPKTPEGLESARQEADRLRSLLQEIDPN